MIRLSDIISDNQIIDHLFNSAKLFSNSLGINSKTDFNTHH